MYKLILGVIMAIVLVQAIEANAEICPLGDVVIINDSREILYECLSYNEEKDLWEAKNGNKVDYYNPDKVTVENEEGRYFRKFVNNSKGKKVARIFLEENSYYVIMNRNSEYAEIVDMISFDPKSMEWIVSKEKQGIFTERRFPVKTFEAFDEEGSMDRIILQYEADKKINR